MLNLGVIIDSNLSFDQPIDATCKSAQFHIRALRHIRGLLSTEVARCVAASIVGSRLDYCNGLLFGATSKNLRKLQIVQNTAARVVTMGRKRDHIGPVLNDLHWLPVKERITLKLATTVFKTLSCSEPSYLLELMEDYKPSRSQRSSQKQLLNPQMPKVKIHLRTPKGGGLMQPPPPGFLPSRPNFLKIFLMGMFSGSRNPTVIMKKFYLYCMTLKIKVKHLFA